MRIKLRVCILIVLAVHNGVGTGTLLSRALRDVIHNIKKPFPETVHLEGAVRSISVLEESLRKQGQVPDDNKKNNDQHAKKKI